MTEHASEIRGVLVVSREEGARLGTVAGLYVDTEELRIAAIRFRTDRPRKERYVWVESVQLTGRDILLIDSEHSVKEVSNGNGVLGKSLDELLGSQVTSLDGKHLGTLHDVDYNPVDWRISDLLLEDGRRIDVRATDFTIGEEILVPTECVQNMEEALDRPGVLSRMFGQDRLGSLKRTMRKALGQADVDVD